MSRRTSEDQRAGGSPAMQTLTECPSCLGARLRSAFAIGDRRFVSCRECGLLFENPRSTPHDLESMYNAGLSRWTDLASYESVRSDFFGWVLDVLESRLPNRGELLDVGCGVGSFLAQARERAWDTNGVELSESDVAYARGRGLAVRRCSIDDLGLNGRTFDVVTCLDVLEHLAWPAATMRQVAAAAGAHGHVFIQTGNAGPRNGLFLRGRNPFLYQDGHICIFSRQSVEALLDRCGLTVVELFDERTAQFAVPGVGNRPNRWRRWAGRLDDARRALVSAPDLYVLAKPKSARPGDQNTTLLTDRRARR